LLGWGFGGRAYAPFPPIGSAGGSFPGPIFLPLRYNRRQTYKKNCPKGLGGSTERGYPILFGGPGTGLYSFVNEIETREAGRGQNKPSNFGRSLA